MSRRKTYGVLAIAFRHGRIFQKLVSAAAAKRVSGLSTAFAI